VPPLDESRAAAWRMANVDDLRNLRYDSFAITRGRHARWLRYTTMSGRIDVQLHVLFTDYAEAAYQRTDIQNMIKAAEHINNTQNKSRAVAGKPREAV